MNATSLTQDFLGLLGFLGQSISISNVIFVVCVLYFKWIILCVRKYVFHVCVVCCVFYLLEAVYAWQMPPSCLNLVPTRNLLNN